MMDLTLSQIAVSRRTMSVYFFYMTKNIAIYTRRADTFAIRKIARVVGSCRHRPTIPLPSRLFLTRRFGRFVRHDSRRLIIYRFAVVSINSYENIWHIYSSSWKSVLHIENRVHSTLDSTRDFIKSDFTVYCYGKKHKSDNSMKKKKCKNLKRTTVEKSLKPHIVETYGNNKCIVSRSHQGIRNTRVLLSRKVGW